MAKKHWILIAAVTAGLAVGAPAAMAAPELPGLPALPAVPAAPLGASNDGDCSTAAGAADAQSDGTALQAPVPGIGEANEANCQSSGNDQGNGLGGG